MFETSLLGLPLMASGQAQKHVTHNEALLRLDALVQLSVASRTETTPPVSPAEGARYLVANTATGAWLGCDGQIATWQNGAWVLAAPQTGWRLWVEAEEMLLAFTGSAWKDLNATPSFQNLPGVGVNTSADTTNRLAVAAPAALLTHAGSDARLKINKNAATDTASALFQTGYQGHAEMGLAGDDNFRVKVSSDGTVWTDAIVIDKATGAVSLPATPSGNLADGDRGDISVAASGATWTVNAAAITSGKLGGDVTVAGKALLTAADAAAQTALLSDATASTRGLMPALDKAKLEGAVSRAALAAMPAGAASVQLHEQGREGLFTWDATVAVATHQADTAQGLYVAPNAAANGAWVRNFDGVLQAAWFGAKGDGTTDDAAALNAAIDAAEALGGATIELAKGVFAIGATLVVNGSNVALRGKGGGYIRQSHSEIQASAATRLKWTGAAGGTMLQFVTPAGVQNRSGGGASGLMLDGNAFTAAVGLEIRTWRDAVFQDVAAFACAQDQVLLGVVDYALASGPADTQRISFSNCLVSTFGGSGTYLTSTARGFRLTGGTAAQTGNTSFCDFYSCQAYMAKGVSYYLENSDNCTFHSCSGGAAYDAAVYNMELCSADQDSGTRAAHARAHSVVSSQLKIRVRAAQSGGLSSGGHFFLGISRANGNPLPVFESGAGGSPDGEGVILSTEGLTYDAGAARLNTVRNGRFDDGNVGFTASSGWLFAKDAANALTTPNIFSHAGSTSGANRALTPNAYNACAPGDQIYAEAWAKISGLAGSFWAQVAWYDASLGFLSNGNATALTADSSGAASSGLLTAPANAAWYRVSAVVNKTAGTVYVDRLFACQVSSAARLIGDGSVTSAKLGGDVTTAGKAMLTAASAAAQAGLLGLDSSDLPNQVPNGTLELGDTGFTRGAGWTIVSDAANAFSGNYVAVVTGAGGPQLLSNSYSACEPGEVVAFGARLKTSAGCTGLSFYAQVLWYDKDKTLLGQATGSALTADQLTYTMAAGTATAPASACYYRVRAVFTNTAGTGYCDSLHAFKKRDAALLLGDGTVTLTQLGGTITAAGKALLDDADAAAQRTSLGLGTAATQPSTAFEASGAVTAGINAHLAAGDPHPQYLTQTEGDGRYALLGSGGSGDVTGPASATDKALVRFSGTAGKTIQNSGVLLNDDGSLRLPMVAAVASPADTLHLFAQDVAGRDMLASRSAYGAAVTTQPMMARNKIGFWNPPGTVSTLPGVFGIAAPTTLGTPTARAVAATNLLTRMRRLGYVSATTAGSFSGHYATANQFSIGDGAGLGGFLMVVRFGVSDAAAVSGARMFVGLRNATAAPTNVEPSTLTNAVGVAQLSTSGNLQIVYGGSAAQTAIDLGASFPANTLSADAYELALYAPSGSQVINYRVERLNTGAVASGTLSGTVGTAIPAATTFLNPAMWRCNNATALAVGIDITSYYLETDT